MSLPRPLRDLTAALLFVGLSSVVAAAPAACPFKPDDLTKTFGVGFAAGKEEPGMGGTSCVYRTQGGSMAHGTEFSLYVRVLKPGPD